MNHSTIPSTSPGFSLVGLSNMRSVPRRKTSYVAALQISIWREPGQNGGFIGFNGDSIRFDGDLIRFI